VIARNLGLTPMAQDNLAQIDTAPVVPVRTETSYTLGRASYELPLNRTVVVALVKIGA
jgi:hypothetical protein